GHLEGDVHEGELALGVGHVDVAELDHPTNLNGEMGEGDGGTAGRRVAGRARNPPSRRPAVLPHPPSACSRSAMMSAASSIPQESRMNPSGMPSAARPSGPIALWLVLRGSETRLSTPPRLVPWITSRSRRRNRSAAATPP